MTAPEFTNFDPAEYLDSPAMAAAYLEATIEEYGDDTSALASALGAIIRSGNVSEIARKTGMSREGLYKAFSSDGNPSLATVTKVAHAVGLQLEFRAIA